jgi:hypothetical protein
MAPAIMAERSRASANSGFWADRSAVTNSTEDEGPSKGTIRGEAHTARLQSGAQS